MKALQKSQRKRYRGMKEIFKVQLPLASNMKEPFALIYNQSRSIEVHLPVEYVKPFFKEGEKKIYVDAELEEDGELFIYFRVPEQNW